MAGALDKNEGSESKKDWDGQTDANNSQTSPSASQSKPKLRALYPSEIAKLKKIKTRPNNYCLIVPILEGSKEFHISEPRMTGRGTPTETVRKGDITVIKYSDKKIVIYLKKKFAKSVLYSEEFREFHSNIMKFLSNKLYDFMQTYTEASLDWSNSILYPRDIGIRDPDIDINPSLTWNKPIHKKVYMNREFEIKNSPERHFDSVEGASSYIDNRILENRLPRIESVIERFSEQVSLHLDVERRQGELLDKQNEVLEELRKTIRKKSIWEKIKEALKR